MSSGDNGQTIAKDEDKKSKVTGESKPTATGSKPSNNN